MGEINFFDYQDDASSIGKSLNPFAYSVSKKPETKVSGSYVTPIGGGEMSPTVGVPSALPANPERYPVRKKNVPSVKNPMDYLSDDDVKSLIDEGATDEEIIAIAKEIANEKVSAGDSVSPQVTEVTEPTTDAEKTPEEPSAIRKGLDFLEENIGGFGSGFASIAGNLASASAYVDPSSYIGGNTPSAQAEKNKKLATDLLVEKGAEDKGGFGAGKFAGEIGVMSMIPVGSTSEIVGPTLSKIGPEKLKAIAQYVATKAPKSSAVAKSFVDALPSAAQFQLLDEGKVTPETTATYAAFAPFLNVMKSLPGVRNVTGKSEILNATAISKGEAIYKEGTNKIVGTLGELNAALDRVGGDSSELARDLTKKAVNSISTKGVTRPKDLVNALTTKEAELSNARRELLSQEKTLFGKGNSNVTYEYKGTKTTSNPIKDAFDDLDKAISPENATILANLKSKFNNGGLNANEVDELAKLHSKYNNAFTEGGLVNKSKEGLEGTRKALKGLISSTETGKLASEFDKALSPIINLRKRAEEFRQAVDLAKSKSVFNFGEQSAKAISNAFDAKTGRAVAKTFGSSGEVKPSKLSIEDMAKRLSKDLEAIQRLSNGVSKTKSQEEALKLIEQFKFDGEKPVATYGVIPKPSASPKVSIADEVKKSIEKGEFSTSPIPRKKNIPKPKK